MEPFGTVLLLSFALAIISVAVVLIKSADGFDECLPSAVAAGAIVFWAVLFISMLILAAL